MKDEDDDWVEFSKWFEENKKRFCDGQFDDKEIAFDAWLEGMRWIANRKFELGMYRK